MESRDINYHDLKDHERYLHKVLVLAADILTMSQIEDSYRRATGKSMPAVPGAFAWLLVKMNKATQDLYVSAPNLLQLTRFNWLKYRIKDMEQNHYARASGDYPELSGEVALANSAYKMKTFYEWVKLKQEKKETSTRSRDWNQVSLAKLFTGRM